MKKIRIVVDARGNVSVENAADLDRIEVVVKDTGDADGCGDFIDSYRKADVEVDGYEVKRGFERAENGRGW